MPAHEMMTMPLLPPWLGVVWALALLSVVALHIHHAWQWSGQHRWWHLGHAVMAMGMIVMYLLPTMTHPVLARAGLVVFAGLSVAVLSVVATVRRREGVFNPLWLGSALDMLAMTYMFLPATARPAPVTWILIGYLVAQMVAWTANLWSRLPLYAPAAPVPAGAAPGAARAVRPVVGLSGRTTVGVRATLAVMAAAMAYMLLAMRVGADAMPMPGMPMPGM